MNTGATGLKHPEYSDESALYPGWLLAAPLKLAVQGGCPQYQGPLTLLAGPHRVEAGWLEGDAACALRDYFVSCARIREDLGYQVERTPEDGLREIGQAVANGAFSDPEDKQYRNG